MYREGTGGTGGAGSTGLREGMAPSAVEGRILELPGEDRRDWNSPPCVRFGVVGEVVVVSDVPGMRIVGSDFLRDGSWRVSEGTRGGDTREDDEGVVGIGGGGGGGAGVGVGTCESPNPGGSAGSGKSDAAPPLDSGLVALAGVPATAKSETAGVAGSLRPNEA